jgi:galactoside 2-L-fucosyltransferase 1/2
VGIHVRRGDLLKNKGKKGLYRIAPKEYFLKMMDSLRTRLSSPLLFIVISDSLDWCRRTFTAPDVQFLNASTAIVEMKILASMDHLILSVGTFGWWSAYLSSAKSITYYKHWYNADTDVGRKFRPNDFFPPDWIGAE